MPSLGPLSFPSTQNKLPTTRSATGDPAAGLPATSLLVFRSEMEGSGGTYDYAGCAGGLLHPGTHYFKAEKGLGTVGVAFWLPAAGGLQV